MNAKALPPLQSDVSDHALLLNVQALLYREAYYLDTRDWDSWLALFTDDVEFWMPAWLSEDQLATDPELQLALLHCEGREDLEDRVFRIRTEDSLASSPLPRSAHVVGNVLILGEDAGHTLVSASWTVHQYTTAKGSRVHGGRYEYRLCSSDAGLRITAKKVIFLNDGVDIPLDIYNV
jgi:benzoate/toluate 1,2-dioxygenase beta subunit